ncbi:MAG: hypothetical protein EP329_08090 [Deltaproteobacteria bacterium]|nr:MAG: hypothetical protein EP329_08090 [Deltaproteobacteria bacterium]
MARASRPKTRKGRRPLGERRPFGVPRGPRRRSPHPRRSGPGDRARGPRAGGRPGRRRSSSSRCRCRT